MTSEVMDLPECGRHAVSTFNSGEVTVKHVWILPAFLAVAFLSFSIWAIVTTGQPFGFVAEHTHSTWGAQIGLDLFNALFAGMYFATVLSRQYHFRAWPYVLLTLCTGSPGVLALAARVLYARSTIASVDSSGSLPALKAST